MAVQVVACVTINPDEQDALEEYMSVTRPLLDEVGAQIKTSFGIGDAVVGEPVGERLMIVEYPSLEALNKIFESDAYKSIVPARDRAFSKYSVSIIEE